jgi:glutathione S-transferase
MTLVPMLREFASHLADAWWVALDAFSAADLLPLFAIWGAGLVTAEGRARLDALSTDLHSPNA